MAQEAGESLRPPLAYAKSHHIQEVDCNYWCPKPSMNVLKPRKQITKKSVTLKSTATVRVYPSSCKDKKTKSNLYYSKQELNVFQLEAKAICNSGTILPLDRDFMIGLNDNNDGNNATTNGSILRGLELLMYPKRRQNKHIAIRSLMKYQTLLNSRPNMSTERKHQVLAAASAKLNSWSCSVAIKTAQLDALRAYANDCMIPIEMMMTQQHPMIATTITSPLSFLKQSQRRRNEITPDSSPRAKRRKVGWIDDR